MSEFNPYEKLGVTENASFEEIQKAKNDLQQQLKPRFRKTTNFNLNEIFLLLLNK